MTRVVVVSRTRMHGGVCVGALVRDDMRMIRLCAPDGSHAQPHEAPYRIGDVWDLEFEDAPFVVPPHVEDVILHSGRFVAPQSGLGRYLRPRVEVYGGGPDVLFEGNLRFTPSGRGFIAREAVPSMSVGFWAPDAALSGSPGPKSAFRYENHGVIRTIAYVGDADPPSDIQAGSLLRVSLARWWAGEDGFGEERCWLQLSGVIPE